MNRLLHAVRGLGARRQPAAALTLLFALLFVGCGAPSTLDPHGRGAGRVALLWWVMLGIAVAIYGLVVLLLGYALFHPREDGSARVRRGGRRFGLALIVAGGVLLPIVALSAVLGLSTETLHALSNPDSPSGLTVEVVAHDWWWEIRYPGTGAVTANELHIPVGRQVTLKLTSQDVIHSFWVPQLNSKLDVIPGRTNTLTLKADDPGSYRGQCAEYCGLQHAHMAFFVIADPPDQFAAWLANEGKAVGEPASDAIRKGQQVFLGSSCSYCHAVRGTNASGTIGPDLTHFASRQTFAAGTLPNTPGYLAGWVVNPQTYKPGNKMPATNFDAQSLQALLTYLESLK